MCTCIICLETMVYPRVLHCGHTFCSICTHDLMKRNGSLTIKCPLCRRLIFCPSRLIRTNYALLNLVKRNPDYACRKKIVDEKLADRGIQGANLTTGGMPFEVDDDDIDKTLREIALANRATKCAFYHSVLFYGLYETAKKGKLTLVIHDEDVACEMASVLDLLFEKLQDDVFSMRFDRSTKRLIIQLSDVASRIETYYVNNLVTSTSSSTAEITPPPPPPVPSPPPPTTTTTTVTTSSRRLRRNADSPRLNSSIATLRRLRNSAS